MHPGQPTPPAPKISFILYAPLAPEERAALLAALRAHPFHDFECLVTGACAASPPPGTDGDARFRFLPFQAPASMAAAANTGLRLARGRHVAPLRNEPPPADLGRILESLDTSAPADPPAGLTILRTDAARAAGGFDEAGGEPDLGFLRPAQRRDLPVLFLPHKDYHVWTIGLIAPHLRALGVDFLTLDLTPQWGEAGVRAGAARHGIPLLGLGEFMLGRVTPRLTVTFNDWDYISRPLLLCLRAAGLATLGIVEGIQDYDDADTGLTRQAYRLVETVILPGLFDYRHFADAPGQRVFVAGVPRIEAMRNEPASPLSATARRRILVNSNFSYGVLTEHRDAWLTAAVRAVEAAGYEPVISRHPADEGRLFPELVSKAGFYETLHGCAGSVQRFASGVLEAIARERPVFYFNPHGETADKFTLDPMGAYPVSRSSAELAADLADLAAWQRRVKENGPAFLDLHAGERGLDIAGKISGVIAALAAAPPPAGAAERLQARLAAIDRHTDAFCARDAERYKPFLDLDSAAEQLDKLPRKRECGRD